MAEQVSEQNKTQILLVEVDVDLGEILSHRLTKRGYKVSLVVTAEEALKLLDQISFDTVVSEIKLPKMDGISFLRKVREKQADLPVILLTGYATLESAKEAVRLSAFDYIQKPLEDIEQLLGPLQKADEYYFEKMPLPHQAA